MTAGVEFDLGPAARRTAGLLTAVTDDLLTAATPCAGYRLGDLIEHIGGLAAGFTAAATKEALRQDASPPPAGDASRLGDDWRTRIPARLADLAQAWRAPAAWQGTTRAGGVDLPAPLAARVALDELVVHGWDVARSTGQPYACEPWEIEACTQFALAVASRPAPGLFAPPVEVPADAPPLDRLLALTGRGPSWTPPH
ncbi:MULTISPECIES: TIGR03086 family metal-binding protein [Streptomyces]|uniref:TIGR03086 family metal-binding protein n=1 Tax=Streptomyces luteosporeus TaxID=173856 RepID=A0ABN3TZU2_9ACTN